MIALKAAVAVGFCSLACKGTVNWDGCRLLYVEGGPLCPAGCVCVDADGGLVVGPDAGGDADGAVGSDGGGDGGSTPDAGVSGDAGLDAGAGATDGGTTSDAGGSTFVGFIRVSRCASDAGNACDLLGETLSDTVVSNGDTLQVDSVTLADAGVFRLVFDPAFGGTITKWYDLEDDPSATDNLASNGNSNSAGIAYALTDFWVHASADLVAGIDSCEPDSLTHLTLLEASAVRARIRSTSHPSRKFGGGPTCQPGGTPTHNIDWQVKRDYTIYASGQVFIETVVTHSTGETPPARIAVATRYGGDWQAYFFPEDGGSNPTLVDPDLSCTTNTRAAWMAIFSSLTPRTLAVLGSVPNATGYGCDDETGKYTTIYHNFNDNEFPSSASWSATQLLLIRPANLYASSGAGITERFRDLEARKTVDAGFDAREGAFVTATPSFTLTIPQGITVHTPVVRYAGACSAVDGGTTNIQTFAKTDGGCVAQIFPPDGIFTAGQTLSLTFVP
ncbi:MAG: hypothetical protein HYY84_15095 [Deltaproteobacteria bacterium]|nr:hypothetical protein [Deltaproteobacteria bacterium]